ncbi:MAG: M28 family peptidase [Clostridia bacterium]|nr:M28 family peptidase [Clostridia bacterium]
MHKGTPVALYGRSFYLVLLMALFSVFLFPLTACQNEAEAEEKPADYGSYGSNFALKLAQKYPNRSPGSEQEDLAGDLIIDELEELGYEPEMNVFSFTDESGATRTSRNICVTLPGQGFTRTDEEGNEEYFKRQVIVGAHYDAFFSVEDVEAYRQTTEPTLSPTPIPESEETETSVPEEEIKEPSLPDYDGIHDNASGIGALMTIAREIQNEKMGYDVILVAFGAGEAGRAGARSFVSRMTSEDMASTDAMYCIDSIYAGDKVYAHAGRNSLRSNYQKSYEKRRKLYEVTDVFYEYELYSNNGYMLYTNQCNFDVTIDGVDTPVLFREWTLTESDYIPFDECGIPIVFFESYDYDGDSLDDLKESKNPAFSSTNGAIRHTPFDSTAYISQIMNQQRKVTLKSNGMSGIQSADHLSKRVNNTAFVVIEAIRKGVYDAKIASDTTQGSENEDEMISSSE